MAVSFAERNSGVSQELPGNLQKGTLEYPKNFLGTWLQWIFKPKLNSVCSIYGNIIFVNFDDRFSDGVITGMGGKLDEAMC